MSQHVCTTSRAEDQSEENKSDDAKCPKSLSGQSEGENPPTTEEFTYISSTVRHDSGAGSDIRNRLNMARNAFRMLNNMWKSS